jgi:hypothetical protein
MENLFMECPECDGDGFITIDLNDTHIPYEQNPVDYDCMYCDGKGKVIRQDELECRIEVIEDMILGMETRIQVISQMLKATNSQKFLDRLDTLSRAYGRLKMYKNKLLNLA